MNTPVAELRSLRALLVERAASAPAALAGMYLRMVAVMDNHVAPKGGRRELPFRRDRKPSLREFHRHVSLTIDGLYGIRNTPR